MNLLLSLPCIILFLKIGIEETGFMSDFEKQDFRSIARVYDEFFVPALFQQWADHTLDAAHVQTGQHVLDIACGTGVVSRAAAARVGASGSVIGFDINEGMLAVAAHRSPEIEFRQGNASALPFEDARFDAVVCQFGLMFFPDRPLALQEMMRVLRPGGHLAVTVWDSLDHTPGYKTLIDLLFDLFGEEAAAEMRPPFVLGNTNELQSIFAQAGIPNATITTHMGTARFPSLEEWLYTEIKGWVLADKLDDAQYDQLRAAAPEYLAQFITPDEAIAFDSPAHIVSATK
jgi:ubiquinone/menaquinone biosynthesis C-methylase UbiE